MCLASIGRREQKPRRTPTFDYGRDENSVQRIWWAASEGHGGDGCWWREGLFRRLLFVQWGSSINLLHSDLCILYFTKKEKKNIVLGDWHYQLRMRIQRMCWRFEKRQWSVDVVKAVRIVESWKCGKIACSRFMVMDSALLPLAMFCHTRADTE